MKPGTSSAYIRVENKTMIIVVAERAAFDAVPGEVVQHGVVATKELRTDDGVVLIFQHWSEASDVALLELYEQAKHGIIIRHRRRSDEDRPLCRKAFRVGSATRRGWDRECVQCNREVLNFEEQRRTELAKFAQAQQAGNGEITDEPQP